MSRCYMCCQENCGYNKHCRCSCHVDSDFDATDADVAADVRPEYDFKGGERGKYAERYKKGAVVEKKGAPVEIDWFEFVGENHLCGLCGNSGVIDTRGKMYSAAGVECGVLAFCICPNGRGWKRQKADLKKLAEREKRLEKKRRG